MRIQQFEGFRVLLITGEPFSNATATGITLCNLFASFRRENLAQLYTASLPIRSDVCGSFFKLSAANQLAAGPTAAQEPISSPVSSPSSKPVGHVDRGPRAKAKALARRGLAPFLDFVPYKVSPSLLEPLRSFRPDVLYSLGGSLRQLQLVLDVSRALSAPFVIHFMDDWPSTLYRSPFLIPMRRRLNKLTLEAVGRAKSRLGISAAMASEYSSRYGAPFFPFMNCVERAKVRSPQGNFSNPAKAKIISYFGGLHLGRWEAILSLAEAIKKRGFGSEFELWLYCRDADAVAHRDRFASYSHVRFKPPVPPSYVSDAMEEADVLLHVESFLPKHRTYTRLSISTKIPEYLATNRPILAIGPAEVASIRYLDENASAIVLTDTEPDRIADGLQRLRDANLMAQLSKNAFELVMRNHVAESERERFKKTLFEAISA